MDGNADEGKDIDWHIKLSTLRCMHIMLAANECETEQNRLCTLTKGKLTVHYTGFLAGSVQL